MRVIIFSGTSEGHALCRFLSARGACADAYVATEYGEAVMEELPGITVHTGRLTAAEMAREIGAGALVIDATHPYAREVTENIRAACRESEYLRLIRPRTAGGGVETVPDTAAAVRWLNAHEGRALLTTGSKELDAYTGVENYRERLFPRVLPSISVLEKCVSLGFPGAHIIAMQGPFSRELNAAILRQTGADILVTKDTGAAGGFAEKLAAARDTGARVLVIARPSEESGLTLGEVESALAERLELREPAQKGEQPPRFPLFVSLVGKHVLVAGAGTIAARRIGVLRRFGAKITVVAPENRADLAEDTLILRKFEPRDLENIALAVAATDDRAANHEIYELCRSRCIPVSVADCAAESSFYFPAICEGGGLTAGLVSRGEDHRAVRKAAARIRKLLQEVDNDDPSGEP